MTPCLLDTIMKWSLCSPSILTHGVPYVTTIRISVPH